MLRELAAQPQRGERADTQEQVFNLLNAGTFPSESLWRPDERSPSRGTINSMEEDAPPDIEAAIAEVEQLDEAGLRGSLPKTCSPRRRSSPP